jgi:hypothetical protein
MNSFINYSLLVWQYLYADAKPGFDSMYSYVTTFQHDITMMSSKVK